MCTALEDLPNELILEIFDYVKIGDLSIGLWNLNIRLNQIIRRLRYLSLIITRENTRASVLFAPQITRVVIVTLMDIPLNSFVNLRSLTINMATENHVRRIRPNLLPHLVYLSIPILFDPPATKQLASEIFSGQFPSLRYADLNIIDLPDTFSWSQSSSLRSLHLFSPNVNIISLILQTCPQLIHLQIHLTDEHQLDRSVLPPLSDHPLRNFHFVQPPTSTFVVDITALFPLIPYLKRLDFRLCTRSFIDLLRSIAGSFAALTRFDCHIIEHPNKDEAIEIHPIRNIHPGYSNIQCTLREDCFCLYTTKRM